jgi:hypothetical protein
MGNLEEVKLKYIGLKYGHFTITGFIGRYVPSGDKFKRNYFEKECDCCGRKSTVSTSTIEKEIKNNPGCVCRGNANIHTNEKRCITCNEWYPATTEYFFKGRDVTFQLSYYCKPCEKKKSKVYKKKYRDKFPKSPRTRNHTGVRKPIKTIESEVEKLKKELLDVEFGSFKVTSYDGRYKTGNSQYDRYYFVKECKFCGVKHTQSVSHLKKSIKQEIKCNLCKESINIHTNEKKCACCDKWLPATYEHFPLSKNRPFGVHYYCLVCHNKRGRKHRENPEVREKEYEQRKRRMETDIIFKMSSRLKSNIKMYVRRVGVKGTGRKHTKSTMADILGGDYEFFKKWIEEMFTEGMTWENHGEWHFDHLIPTSYAETVEELYELCHHTNYRPMWGDENVSKGNKLYINEISEENRIRYKKFIDRYIDSSLVRYL